MGLSGENGPWQGMVRPESGEGWPDGLMWWLFKSVELEKMEV